MIVPGRAAWLGLVGLTALLGSAVAYEVAGPEAEPSIRPMNRVAAPQAAQAEQALPPGQQNAWLREILGRPLFSPDRKPIGSGDVRGLPRLTGIVVSGSRRVAIFASGSGGGDHPIVREAGTRLGAYDVLTIDDAGVTVRGPGGTTVIRPLFDTATPAPKRPPAQTLGVPRVQAK